MRIGFLITARLKSKRLPLKLLKDLNGFSIIDRVIQRAKLVKECDDIILCTSENNQDLPLIRTAQDNKIFYFNGDEDDVLSRLLKAANLFNLDFAVCMTADNPLFSINYANRISDIVRQSKNLDYIYTDDLPIGLNVYGVSINALDTICSFKEELDTEIWGPLINRPDIFSVMKLDVDSSDIPHIKRLTVDERLDYEMIKIIFESFPKNHLITEPDIINLLNDRPEIKLINKTIKQRSLDSKTIERIDKFFKKNKLNILERKNKNLV